MKPFSTLFAKIVFWSFLNLLIVAGVFAALFAVQFRGDLRGLLGKQARDRMRAAARIVSHELEHSTRDQWQDILTRHSEIHQVELSVISRRFSIAPSDDFTIPDKVRAAVEEALSFDFRTGKKPRGMRFFDRRDPEKSRLRGPGLTMRTENPTRYWMGVYMPLFIDPGRPPKKAVLLASSASLSGGGFFFDPAPWIAAACLVLALSVIFWVPFVRHITGPLKRMTRAAEKVAMGRFDVRIEEKRADEIGRLSRAINHMTARLSGYMNGQKRFLGDVAHELGSPIARIQLGLGILEQRCDGENRERVRDVLEDVHHMSGLVNELLSFTRAEMTPRKVKLEIVGLAGPVQKAVDRENRPGVDLRVEIPDGLTVRADPELLTRAIANLVRNAVAYAGDRGPITVKAQKDGLDVHIEVKDCGSGVPEESTDRLFEPFFRPEPSRNRRSGGVGLGLAIVKTCVEACNGSVSARNIEPAGFAVTIRMMSDR